MPWVMFISVLCYKSGGRGRKFGLLLLEWDWWKRVLGLGPKMRKGREELSSRMPCKDPTEGPRVKGKQYQ